MKKLNRDMKIAHIQDVIVSSCSISSVLEWTYEQGWNMVLGNDGRIMINKAGTKDAIGSYKEGHRDLSERWIESQSDDTVDFVYGLLPKEKLKQL